MLFPLVMVSAALGAARYVAISGDVEPAARMLIAEAGDVDGDMTGEWGVILTVATNRARIYRTPLALVVAGPNPPGGASAWNSSDTYRQLFAEAPSNPRYARARRFAAVELFLGRRDPRVGDRIGFVHGERRPAWLTSPVTIGRVTVGGIPS